MRYLISFILIFTFLPWFAFYNKEIIFNYKDIDKEILTQDYYLDFKYDLLKRNLPTEELEKIKIYIGHGLSLFSFTGYCDNMHLDINKNKFLKLNIKEQKRIFYHELGHCLYNYKHRATGIMSYDENGLDDLFIEEFFNLNNKYEKFNNLNSEFSLQERIKEHYENEKLLYGEDFSPLLFITRLGIFFILIFLFFISFIGFLYTKVILLKKGNNPFKKREKNDRN